jgi:molecular chaperone IbpA
MTERRITRITPDKPGFGDPFFIGFEGALAKLYDKQLTVGTVQNYPPYNIIKDGNDHYLIELAIAGFSKDDIEIITKGDSLTIIGKTSEKDENLYLHKGISSRNFERKFTLADTIEVLEADIQNGMLLIRLRNNIPEYKKERKIKIGHLQLYPDQKPKTFLQE